MTMAVGRGGQRLAFRLEKHVPSRATFIGNARLHLQERVRASRGPSNSLALHIRSQYWLDRKSVV